MALSFHKHLQIVAGVAYDTYRARGTGVIIENETIYRLNKAIMGPATQQFSSSSDVIATTCLGHTTIIKRHTVLFCLKLFA
jgi:hypothetical protein